MSFGPVARLGAATPPTPTSPGAVAAPASLLPETSTLSGPQLSDAMSLLYVALSKQRDAGAKSAADRVQSGEKQEEAALDDEKAALQREQSYQPSQGTGFFASIGHFLGDLVNDATHLELVKAVKDAQANVKAMDNPAFWNDLERGSLIVAKLAAVVGSTAATVATFGAAGVTVACVALLLSASGEVVTDTKCFGDKASSWVGLGLGMAGAVVGGVGAATSVGEKVAEDVGQKAVLKAVGGVGIAATAVSGAAQGVGAVAHVKNAEYAADAEHAAADAQDALDHDLRMQQLVQWMIDDLKTSDKSQQHAQQTLQGVTQTIGKTAVVATAVLVKG